MIIPLSLLTLGAGQSLSLLAQRAELESSLMTCEECSHLGSALSEAFTSKEAIALQLALIDPVVCPEAPNPGAKNIGL